MPRTGCVFCCLCLYFCLLTSAPGGWRLSGARLWSRTRIRSHSHPSRSELQPESKSNPSCPSPSPSPGIRQGTRRRSTGSHFTFTLKSDKVHPPGMITTRATSRVPSHPAINTYPNRTPPHVALSRCSHLKAVDHPCPVAVAVSVSVYASVRL